MRTVAQPGPPGAPRIVQAGAWVRRMAIDLPRGATLAEAVAGPLAAAGFGSAAVEIHGAVLSPFRYVVPAEAADARHVAYFSDPRAPAGETRLERANLTFGWDGDAPALHCHAVWIEPDGARRGGHILPRETALAADARAEVWAFEGARIATAFDPETNFPLLDLAPGAADGGAALARARPNEDIVAVVESVARSRGWTDADVVGSLGSLVGAAFEDGRTVPDVATEVLVRRGRVRGGRAELDLSVVDMGGRVHDGRLARGANAVLITFDLALVPAA